METIPGKNNSPRENLRAIRLLCIALITGVSIFAFIMVVLVYMNGPGFDTVKIRSYREPILAGTALITLISYGWALRSYNKKIKELQQSGNTLMDRLNVYREILIKYMAGAEMPAMLAIILYFLSGLQLLILIPLLMLLAMLWKAPFGRKWITETGAGWQDEEKIKS